MKHLITCCALVMTTCVACGETPSASQHTNAAPPSIASSATAGTLQPTAPGGNVASPPSVKPQPSVAGAIAQARDAGTAPVSGGTSGAPAPVVPGLPSGSEKIAGLDFMQRIAGKWSGMNTNTPLGFDFPMSVEFAPSDDGLLFGRLDLDANNSVVWGFSIETYDGQDVLAYRNGGHLGGVLRDTRTKLIEHDAARGYYRFCAVKEQGIPVDGCNYIDARYTFTGTDKMLFEVTVKSGRAHVRWDATRQSTVTLPTPFPASSASRGDGSAPWPAGAGIQ